METIWNIPARVVVTVLVAATLAAGLGIWRWKKCAAILVALVAIAVAMAAATVVGLMLESYRGDELGQAIPWFEQTGFAIAGISLGAFALCFVCLMAEFVERLRKRIEKAHMARKSKFTGDREI